MGIFVTVAVSPANLVLGRCFEYAKLSVKRPKIDLEINTNMSSLELLNILLSKSQNYIHNVLSSIYCLEDNHKLYVTEAPVIKMTLLKCLI